MQLAHRTVQVALDRPGGEHEVVGDLPIGQARHRKADDLSFARRQLDRRGQEPMRADLAVAE